MERVKEEGVKLLYRENSPWHLELLVAKIPYPLKKIYKTIKTSKTSDSLEN